MTKITTHLDAKQLATLRTINGNNAGERIQTDGDRVRWLVDFFQHLRDLRDAKERDERKPRLVAALSDVGADVADERESVNPVGVAGAMIGGTCQAIAAAEDDKRAMEGGAA